MTRPPETAAGRRHSAASALLRWASYFFLAAGLCALGYTVYLYASARAFEKTAIMALSARPPKAPSVERLLVEGTLLGRIQIERVGLSAVIAQGDSPAVLSHAVGHVPATALPGERGNVALAAHRDTLFRPLRKIRAGDAITLTTSAGEYRYEVQSTSIVPPTDVGVLRSSGGEELTLITCYPFYYIGPAPDRFIVHARRTPLTLNDVSGEDTR
jgi:sortase A